MIFIASLLLFTTCEKDDITPSPAEDETTFHLNKDDVTSTSINEIPYIADFLSTKGNGRGTFEIDKSIYNLETRSSEPDLVIGELQTGEIIKVTNGVRSNYTFILKTIESNDPTSKSIFNLIVEENSQGLFSYITEYRPNLVWYNNFKIERNFSTFTGDMLYFTLEGLYLGKASLEAGNVVSAETRNPCPPGDDNGNGGNSGGNGDSSGDSGGDSGNNGGSDIEIIIFDFCVDCKHPEHLPHSAPCAHPICTTVIEVHMKSANGTKNKKFLRNPCNNIPDVCYQDNTDPCPNGCNAAGDGCADGDEDPGVGVFIDLNSILLANTIEESIIDDDLNECHQNILNELKELENSDISDVISRFIPTEPYGLEIKTETLTPLLFGSTNWQTENGNALPYDYIIKISDSPSSSTDLHVAQTLLHELIHALFLSYADDLLQTGDTNLQDNFPNLWNWYVLNRYGGNANSPQHEALASNYVDALGRALQEFDTGNPIPEDEDPDQLYSDMAWGGLTDTTIFNQNHPEGSESRERIENRIFAEAFNVTSGDQTPSGSPCN